MEHGTCNNTIARHAIVGMACPAIHHLLLRHGGGRGEGERNPCDNDSKSADEGGPQVDAIGCAALILCVSY